MNKNAIILQAKKNMSIMNAKLSEIHTKERYSIRTV